jgi:hypothetical protein
VLREEHQLSSSSSLPRKPIAQGRAALQRMLVRGVLTRSVALRAAVSDRAGARGMGRGAWPATSLRIDEA